MRGTGLSNGNELLDATLEEMWKIISFTYQESILLISRLMANLEFIEVETRSSHRLLELELGAGKDIES